MSYVYVLAGDERERELAFAEALALTGGRRCGARLVEAHRCIDPGRTGYVGSGIELLASGKDLDEVCRKTAEMKIASDGFAVEVVRVPRGLKVRRHETASALGWVIQGRPNLDHPKERFLAIATPEGMWFGRRLDATEPDWRRLVRKPHGFSSALPSQAARAICNLAIRGGERVVDPCCGSGTLLIHAAALGAHVAGFDINKKMVGTTNLNLKHFGLEPAARLGDAAEISGDYDLALANLPYGHMSPVTDERAGQMVTNIVKLAPRGVIISIRDVSGEVRAGGARVEQLIRLPKQALTRLIFVYRRSTPPA